MRKLVTVFTLYAFVWLIVAGSLPPSLQAQAKEKITIAVLTIESKGGISPSEAATLTDRLGSMLVNTNAFTVVDRSKMEEILQEQGFQQTGCTSTECAVEVGRLLNVQKMVSGSIGKIGRTYTIDLALIDVQTSQIENSFIRDYQGEIDGLLKEMESIAHQIAAGSGSGAALPETEKHLLSITSKPSGAQVLINDKNVGTTPFSVRVPDGMALNIKLKKNAYQTWQQQLTVINDTQLTPELTPVKGAAADTKPGSKTWLYVTLGAVVIGGGIAAAVLAGGGGDDKPTPEPVTNDLPAPVWPPQ
jgi:TolB-like protein